MERHSSDTPSLREIISQATFPQQASLRGPTAAVSFVDATKMTLFSGRVKELQDKCVLIAAKEQFNAALALIELDGFASRIVICPPDFTVDQLASVIASAKVDAILCDDGTKDVPSSAPVYALGAPTLSQVALERRGTTEWVLPTSGTTGAPKLVAHNLSRLLGAIQSGPSTGEPGVWTTFYDIRRYGGLQVFLRAATRGATLVLSDPEESLEAHVQRCQVAGVTHIGGTPSHWRRLLMSPYVNSLKPKYVRLSGEIADQAVLQRLQAAYPQAKVVHAYASTEAGVVFEVHDVQEGFPAEFLGERNGVEMRVVDGVIQVRSPRSAIDYIGAGDRRLRNAEGFIDTDDAVELRENRYHFLGRRTGVVNIGGLKVHPEEVESTINLHPQVHMSLVKARKNPIIGDIIVAEVMLRNEAGDSERQLVREEILAICREHLDRHKIPAILNFVAALNVVASGKMERRRA
jgi:acyl-coenzyme A synthetase/AMP-(fatty) acid ligase